MRKILSFLTAILFAASMMADSYTITFKDGGTDSDKTSSLTSTTVSDYVDAGAEYVSAIAPTGKVYFAKTGAGLKFGNSSGGGSVTLTLATPIKPTSIVISASQFGASEGSGLFQEETFDMTGGGGKYAFNDYTVTYDGETEVATISVGTAKRGYVNSITVNYASQGGEEPVVEPETKTIYLNGGGSSLWNQANPEFFVHSWGGAADGDVHMTLVEGDVYKADIPADNTDLLFLRLATGTTEIVWSGEAHWNQSTDQTIPEGKDLFTMTSWDNGEWSVYSAQGGETPDPVEPQPVDSMTVYYVNNLAWEAVNAYVWPAEGDAYKAWPGEAMTKEAEQINGFDVYSYTFSASYVNLIFNNGNGGEGNQTADFVWDATKPYFFDGEWYASVEEVAPHCAQVTEGIWTVTETTPLDANSIYVHNNLMKMKPAYAAAWDGFNNPQQFGEYSFTYAMLIRSNALPTEQIPAGAEYVGGSKNTTSLIVEAKEDIDITIFYRRQTGNQSENDSKDLKIFDHSAITTAIQGVFQIVELDGDYFSATKKLSLVKGHRYTITAKGTTPKIFAIAYGQHAEPEPAKFYITGNEDIVGEGNPTWGKNGALESFSDTLVMNLAAGFHKFKLITPAEQWLGMEALTDTAYGLFTDEDTNICFNIAEAGEVTVIYNATEFKLEGDFYIAPKVAYYLIGDSAFVVDAGATADKAWTPDAIPCLTDTTVLNLKAGVDYIMRLSLEGTWENHRDFRHLTDTAAGLIELPDEFGNHSIGFSLAEAGEVTIIYIPAANEQPEVFKLIGNFYVAPAPDPTVSVFGSMTDPAWKVEVPFVLSDDKTYASLTVENIGAGDYDFKFVINGEWRSNGYTYHRGFTGAAGITENNDANMIFQADQDGEYTFYWYFANDSAAIVYPEYIEPAKEYYAKYAPAWEWVKLTEAEGLWLTDTIVYKGIGININDKGADENNMFYSNTVEEEGVRPIAGPAIDVNDTIYFTFNPADSVVTAVMVGKYVAPVEETKDIVIVPGAWEGLHLGAWAWVDGGVGAWYPVVLDNEQLIATIPAAADRLIVATFEEGAELNWDNKINQTPDQVIDACGVLYINSNTPTWCEQGGFVEELYTIAGSGSILGVDWDQTAAINDMVFNAETGIYTLVKENLTLTAFEYQYKVAKDHVWNAGQYPASGNQVLAITEDGIYHVTFTFNPAIPLLTAEAEKIQDIVVEKHYLVVGQDMIANGEDWNNDTDINLMTTADEGLTYTLTVNGAELVADATYRYKIVEKGTWNEYFPNIGGADASFTVEEDGIYTITYTYTVATSQCDVQATKTADLPAARLTDGYYLVGTFSGVPAWTVDDLTEDQRFVEVLTDEYGTSYSLAANLAVDDSIKIVKIVHDAIVLWMPEGTGNNVVIDANHAGEAKIIHLAVAVTGEWSYYVEPNIQDGFYLLGTMNNWTPSDEYRFGKDATCGENEFILNTTLAIDDQIKVAKVENGVATIWYPDGEDNNYIVDAAHAGEGKAIYFQETYKEDWAAFGGYFWMGSNEPTAISNTVADAEAVKVLHNGMLLIRKGDKTYNIMGQAVK